MTEQFDLLKTTRENALKISRAYSPEELNHIPEGFNNNMIWNLAHMVVTQQRLMYLLSGNKMSIDKSWDERFQKGTKPQGIVSAEEIQLIQTALFDTLDQAVADYEAGLFKEFRIYPTSYGYELKSIEHAIHFNNVHEAMHLGNLLSMRKLLSLR